MSYLAFRSVRIHVLAVLILVVFTAVFTIVVSESSSDGTGEYQYADEFGSWSFKIVGDKEAEITGLDIKNRS